MVYYFNIDCGLYFGTIEAESEKEAAMKLYEAFGHVDAVNLKDGVEITELKKVDENLFDAKNILTWRKDSIMLYEDYGIIAK